MTQSQRHLLLFAVALLSYFETEAQTPTATIFPTEYITSLSCPVPEVFRCDASGANSILWVVDGIYAARQEIRDRGITTSELVTINAEKGQFTSNIYIPCTFVNRNVSIVCVANVADVNREDILSAPAFFKVQGLLHSPPNLNLTSVSIDKSQGEFLRLLTWEEPETLNITDVDPDINHYRVCYNISTTTTCKITLKREFIFLNIRVHILFSVTAVNVVGEGSASTIMHWACDEKTSKVMIIFFSYIFSVSLM